MEKIIESQIVLQREFIGVDACQICGGIVFITDDVYISFELLSNEERERAREMIKQGKSLEDLLGEFEIIYDNVITYQCEKCGYTDSSPKYTTM
jgi:rubrerythrin